jgi:AAA15 family ATPase/GTPase
VLIQFNFKNYRSSLNETSLNLIAANITELDSNLIQYKKDEKLLKAVAIYGSNASGKSNLLTAFSQMKLWVTESFIRSEQNVPIPLKKFQFSDEGKLEPSLFEVFFSIHDKEYQYGFVVDQKKVCAEWLYKRNFKFKSKYDRVFERDEQKYHLRKDLNINNDILKSMNEKTLLTTFLSRLENSESKDVVEWFRETSVVNFGDTTFEFIISRTLPKVNFENEVSYKRFVNFLSAIDLGICGIRVEKIDYPEVTDENETANRYKIFTHHKNLNTNEIEELSLSDESSGTNKMISLYYFLEEAIRYGKTLLVDEMDAKLHPLLTRYIINLFQNPETNKKNAQLIFTTHDSSNLNRDLFRRDQIWFVDKNTSGVSELYSLADYKIKDTKIRKDATYYKDYLGGRYGAVPTFKDFMVGE